MIQGRYVKSVWRIWVTKRFAAENKELFLRSPGFVGGGEWDSKSKLCHMNFATEEEASAFAEAHSNDVFVNGNTRRIEHVELDIPADEKYGLPVYADWYMDKQWRSWWHRRPNPKLDVVRMSYGDWNLINDAFDADVKKNGWSTAKYLSNIPLTRFAFEVSGYDIMEFDYSDGDMEFTAFYQGARDIVCSGRCVGMDKTPNEYREEIDFGNPYVDQDKLKDVAFKASWTFVIVNWFINNLPTRVSKQRRQVKQNATQINHKKRKRKQKPLEVVWRDEYEIDLNGLTKAMIRHEIKCLCWGVRGHERHYKNGRVVFIKPYRKGKERDNPDAYVAKTYRKEGDEE